MAKDENKSFWEPIWEYILDDYSEDEGNQYNLPLYARRQKVVRKPPGIFDFDFFDDDESEYDSTTSHRRRVDNRDEKDEASSVSCRSRESSRENCIGINPWRQNSQKGAEGNQSNESIWGLFASHEGTARRSSKTENIKSSKDTVLKGEDEGAIKECLLGGAFLVPKDEGFGETLSEKQKKQKIGFLKRFRKNQNYITEKDTANENTEGIDDKKRHPLETNSDNIDPLAMLFEVAEKLDPWGSDDDSDYETESENWNTIGEKQKEQEKRQQAKLPDSAKSLDQLEITEIRLQHRPARSEDVSNGSSDVRDADGDDSADQCREETAHSRENIKGATIFWNAREESPSVQGNPAVDASNKSPSHMALSCGDEARLGLKRLVCCSVKNRSSRETISQLEEEDAKAVFPAARMVSDDQAECAITGKRADYVNGVLGVPSDRFLETKGPQSLYEYEYESDEHMDIFYDELGQRARTSLYVRRLGSASAFLASCSRDEVVIQVEASTVSETDCIIRQGHWWGDEKPDLPTTPGVDFVGKVYHVKQKLAKQFKLYPRQTVISLVKWGGNSRFISINPNKLVIVPDGMDPAKAVCLPDTYLTAFQTLHHGQVGPIRYRANSLRGKSVLVVGAMANNMGKAIIELSLTAGAANIYATAKKKHWKKLINFGVMPLSQEPADWILRVEGTIDLVLASNGGLRENVTPMHYRALRPTGHLIMCGRRVVGNDVPIGDWEKRGSASLVCSKNKELTKLLNRSSTYDVFEQWDRDLELCKKDLNHLLLLLKHGSIQPTILDRIPLNKVAKAHDLLETKRMSGFVVCEPWMRSKKRAVYL